MIRLAQIEKRFGQQVVLKGIAATAGAKPAIESVGGAVEVVEAAEAKPGKLVRKAGKAANAAAGKNA